MKNLSITIFYADDDPDDLEIFRDVVDSLEGRAQLYTYDGGQELIEALGNPPPTPQLVFLDLNMPGKDGFAALEEIRKNSKFKQVPVIVFSTSDDKVSVERSRHLGANYYLRKPNCYQHFQKTIRSVLDLDFKSSQSQSNFYIS